MDWQRYETTEKYKIISKEIIGDTIKYSIIGKKLEHTFYQGYDWNDEPFNHSYHVSEINSTLTYIDSANNYLNVPVSSLVTLILPYGQDTFLTRVLLDTIDEINQKIVGTSWDDNDINLFKFSNDTNILDTVDIYYYNLIYKLSYSETLGLTKEEYFDFEYGFTKILEGYIKDNDTIGLITPDEAFTSIGEISKNRIKIFPNPANEYLFFNFDRILNFRSIIIYDLDGREQLSSKQIDKLYIGDLTNGLYIIKILELNGVFSTYKFIKE
jgi:hypothetical protein